MVYGQMNEPPGNRLRVALTGLTIAESFRDEGRDVLFFVDNIYRFTLAGTEVSALLGRMPSAVGYQPTLAEEMGRLQERITSTKVGSITSIQAVYVPADDLTDPSPATTFAHLDATVVLSRDIASLGIYPAVDPLDSPPPGRPATSSAKSTTPPRAPCRPRCSATRNCATSSRSWAWTSCRPEDKLAVARARKIQRFLSQPFHVAEVFTGTPGQVRAAEGNHPRLQDDRRRRMRPPARAGVLHGRHDRRGLREGQEDPISAGARHGHHPRRRRLRRREHLLRRGQVRRAARRDGRARHLPAPHAADHPHQARRGAHRARRQRRRGVRLRRRRHSRGAARHA